MAKAVTTAVVLIIIAFAAWLTLSGGSSTAPRGRAVEVKKGNLVMTVTCEGAFQPNQFVLVRPRMETVDRELTITFVVPNGAVVRKDDPLIFFDTADLEDEVSRLKIDVQGAESELIHSKGEVAKAELDQELNVRKEAFNVALAEKELEKYRELDGPRQIKEAEMKLKRTEAELEEAKKNYEEAEEMYKQDLIAGSEVKKAELRLREAEFGFESAKMSNEVLRKYTSKIDLQRLTQNAEDAGKRLESIKPYMEAIVSQRKAALAKAERTLVELKDRLEKKERDIVNGKIFAPVNGMVAYGSPDTGRWGGEGNIVDLKVGNRVGARQTLMYIPDLSRMSLVARVNEMDISKIAAGLPITARADAHPQIILQGAVEKVGLMGSRGAWWDETVKFEVICSIKETCDWFRPDLRARIEISMGELTDVCNVPVEAVFERGGKTVCYLEDGTERPVTIGRSNADSVEIKEGLKPGENVLLTRPAAASANGGEQPRRGKR